LEDFPYNNLDSWTEDQNIQLDEYESGHDEDECSVQEDSTNSVFEVPLIDPFLSLVKGHKTTTKEQKYQLLSACASEGDIFIDGFSSDLQAPVRALLLFLPSKDDTRRWKALLYFNHIKRKLSTMIRFLQESLGTS
jgi:hypothetical protein